MKTLTIEIVSPPDKENLVAEIWQDDQMIAEINQEKETLELEIYINKTGKIKLEFNNFIDTLKKAKKILSGDNQFLVKYDSYKETNVKAYKDNNTEKLDIGAWDDDK